MTRYMIPDSPSVQCTDNGLLYSIPLTQREIQIIIMLYKAMSQKEIGITLHISPNTVRNHLQNVMSKLGVNSSMGIITWYIDSILFIKYGSNFLSLAEEAIQ